MSCGRITLLVRYWNMVPAFVMSTLVTSILLYYSKGNLLIAQDGIGFYNPSNLLYPYLSPTSICNLILYQLTFHNIYASFYLGIFITTALSFALMSRMAEELFEGTIDKIYSKPLAIVAGILYIFNPFVLTVDFQSFLYNINLSSVFYLAFLVELFIIWNNFRTGRITRTRDFTFLGLLLGLSLTPFPNDFRILIVSGIFSVLLLLPSAIARLNHRLGKISFRKAIGHIELFAVFIGALILGGIFFLYPFFLHPYLFLGVAHSSAQNNLDLIYYTGEFNTFPEVIRLFVSWEFLSYYSPYSYLYLHLSYLEIVSYAWPFLFLCAIPLSMAIRRSWRLVVHIATVVLIFFVWEMGGNPPLGAIWYAVNTHLPYGYQLIPTGFLTYLLISKLYPLLISFSLISFAFVVNRYHSNGGETLSRENSFSRSTLVKAVHKNYLSTILIVVLVLMLVSSCSPFFTGGLEKNFFDQNSSGFRVPSEYNLVRSYVQTKNGSILILPGMQNYIQTSWNYSGSSLIYNELLSPLPVFNVQKFGGTSITESAENSYLNLTQPVSEDVNSEYSVNLTWLRSMVTYKISFILVDYSILDETYFTFENTSYVRGAISALLSAGLISQVSNLSTSSILLYSLNLTLAKTLSH